MPAPTAPLLAYLTPPLMDYLVLNFERLSRLYRARVMHPPHVEECLCSMLEIVMKLVLYDHLEQF